MPDIIHNADTIVKGYLGNSLIKKKGEKIEFTEGMIKEYIKCMHDPIYFAEKYIHIVHVDRGLIPIKLYDYQRDILTAITDNRRVAVLTSRQAGKTTTAVASILHYILFNDYKTVGLVANKADSAREILSRIQIAYEALPKWLQQGVVEWNKGSIELENGSKIIASATSSSAIRGKSISYLYIDEAAFVEGWDEFFASVFPTISSGDSTKILFTSTPKGLNHFYKICEGAKNGTNGYKYIEVPWYAVPGRDEAWKQETLAAMNFDIEKFEQEFNLAFLGSSGTLIEGSKLKELTAKESMPLKQYENIKVYDNPEEGHFYVCVADVSRGRGLDYSAAQILDITKMPYKQVCTFRDNNITPTDYAYLLNTISTTYNDAYLLIEINDIGGQVAEVLKFDLEVENMLMTENSGRSGKRISSGFGSFKVDYGIRTTKTVKGIGCNTLKLLIEQDQLILKDSNTINELSTFSKKGASYEAESGTHDDLVMCLVLFSWLTTQSYFKELTDINTLDHLRQKREESYESILMPIGLNNLDPSNSEEHFHHF